MNSEYAIEPIHYSFYKENNHFFLYARLKKKKW